MADREMEKQVLSPRKTPCNTIQLDRSVLQKIDEEVEPIVTEPQPMEPPVPMEPPDRVVSEVTVTDVTLPEDIAELPTQVKTLSQQWKRTADQELGWTPKVPRRSGYKTFRPSQGQLTSEVEVPEYETNKGNISDNIPQEYRQSASGDIDLETVMNMLQEAGLEDRPRAEPEPSPKTNKGNISDNIPQEYRQSASGDIDLETVMNMLQEAGLEDRPRAEPEPSPIPETNKGNISDNIPQEYHQSASGDIDLVTVKNMLQEAGLEDRPRAEPEPGPSKSGSESTETPLGSLDRTEVSLGDSEEITESARFISENWGTSGTMRQIILCRRAGVRPLDVHALVARGPVLPNLKRIIAARCFVSILNLIRHRFIKVFKDPETLEIKDIRLGAKFHNR